MDKPEKPTPKPWFHQIWVSIKQFLTVLGVAFVVATLFTAWTPGFSRSINPQLREFLPIPTQINRQVDQNNSGKETLGEEESVSTRIGIVAGHWGSDSGSVCADGFTEADLNLQVASMVQKVLEEKGFEVDLLGEFDSKLWNYHATALVSIHSDSCDYINNTATGFKVAASMANPNPDRSATLTSCLRSRYGLATGLPVHSLSVTPDMTSYHAFGEIDDNTTAAIIEIGFLNLDKEFLTKNTDQVVSGITNGILCFINNEELTTSTEENP